MDNLPEQNKPAPPIQITEDIQVSLNRLGRDLETHAESGIRIGKELIYLKEITPHGQFGALVEWAYGLKEHTRTNYMNVAEKFKNCNQLQFSSTVLIELSRPSVPESAREEASTKESLTVKQSKELTAEHKAMQKRIDELVSENTRLKEDGTPAPANTKNLLPEIKELLDAKIIMPAMALNISTMDEKGQRAWWSMHVRKNSLENQLREKSQKIKDLESRPEPKAKIVEKEVIPLDVQEKLKKAETALADLKKAENSAKNIRSDFNAVSDEKHKLKHEISELKKQLKVNDPDNIDKAFASDFQELQDLFKSKLFRLNEQQIQHDHPMFKAMGVIEDTISALSAFGEKVKGIGSITV